MQTKQFIELTLDKSADFLFYREKNNCPQQLRLLGAFISDSLPSKPLEWLKYSPEKVFRVSDSMELEKKENSMIIRSKPSDIEDPSNIHELVLNIDNFSMMLRNWEKLREQKAPSIFFVQDSPDTISVRETLEIKKKKSIEERTIKTKPGMFQRFASAFSFKKKDKKKYLLFEKQIANKEMNLKMYMPNSKTMNSDLSILGLVFGISDREEIAQYLEDESKHCYETNIFRIRKDGASVILDQPEHYQCRDKLVIPFNNFKKMLQEWNTITRSGSEKLYFIQESNGTISTSDQLS